MQCECLMTHLRTVAAAVVDTVHAPPAIVFLQELQCQMPTAVRFTESCNELRIAAYTRSREIH
jgi:hypothetical protein